MTIGVEEEFLLVDADTAAPAALAPAVLASARQSDLSTTRFHSELFASQVEASTGVCRDLAELGAQIRHGREVLTAAAAERGLRLAATGVPIVDGPPVPVSEGERFAAISTRFSALMADYQASGCHVHIGVADPDTATAVLNHLSPWLPTLLALSTNSPVRGGRDRGQASLRIADQTRFPGFGLPPWAASAADYDRHVDRLIDCGVLVDERMSFWLVRRSAHLPTVELRVADTMVRPWETLLQAALSRALVRTALTELALGHEAGPVDPQVGAAAVWTAARFGLDGPAVDPVRARPTTITDRVTELTRWVGPALAQTSDTDFVRAALTALADHGTGARRQREAARHGIAGLRSAVTAQVDAIDARTAPCDPPTSGPLATPTK
ncbi:putative glutamate--cysteine ligase 2 [Actinokineospora sp. NBRC 105648]|nr:putative glutamate--cysteine ligase 2 [Actinokineospora sp. NBRC 105648]